VTLTGTDNASPPNSVPITFDIYLEEAPVCGTHGPISATVGVEATDDMSGVITDADEPHWDSLTYVAVENGGTTLPSWISFDEANQDFTFNATENSVSTTVDVTATDSRGNQCTTSVVFNPVVNPAPVITVTDYTFDFTGGATDGARTGTVTDVDGPLTFTEISISGLPAFLTFSDNGDNSFTLTYSAATGGEYNMTVSAYDGVSTTTQLWTAIYN